MTYPIPTNLIMGFLGVGKTTAIRHLLRAHPAGERWAVLVNELGQVGIDGGLLGPGGVAVKQVPGGCLCCVGSAAFGVGLVQLIREARPDRILIEPSGIGHPSQVIAQLTGEEFARSIELRATVTLVDARKLADKRYLSHPAFVDQLEMADVVVANKLDQYGEQDREAFAQRVAGFDPSKAAAIMVEQGRVSPALLDRPRLERRARFPQAHAGAAGHGAFHDHGEQGGPSFAGAGGWSRLEGVTRDYHSVGWRIDPGRCFDRKRLGGWLAALGGLRVKGVMHTDEGWLGVNRADGETQWEPSAQAEQSRLEVIAFGVDAGLDAERLERGLHGCVVPA